MRVALFTSQFPGFVNTFFACDVRGLIDAGAEVDVFAIHPHDSSLWAYVPDLLPSAVLPRGKVHHLSEWTGCRQAAAWPAAWRQAGRMAAILWSSGRHGLQPALKTAYVLPKALAWARQHGGRFDHVLAYWGNYAATCAFLFQRASGGAVPFSVVLHAGTDLYRDRVYMRQKLAAAANIFVVCDFNRRFLQMTYPDAFDRLASKIHLHHPSVPLAELPFEPDGRVPARVVGVGGLHPAKGFDDLLRAASVLRTSGRRVEVVLVGDGPEAPKLRALAGTLGIGDAVSFLGWQPFREARQQIRRAAVLVHPSPGLGDAVPNVIKEAMAIGTPVIASSVAGIPELLDGGACGTLVPPRSPAAIAAALETLFDDPDRAGRHARLARARAEQLFDMTRNTRKLLARLQPAAPAHEVDRMAG